MNVSDYINKLASTAGISADDEQLKTILANESLQQVEINEDLANRINGSFLTVDSAKNNSDLNKHFRATILNGLDAEMSTLMNELKLGDDVRSEIMGETNSFKRVPLLVKKIEALEKAKQGATQVDKNALQVEIERLNGEIATGNTTAESKINDINKQWESRFLDQTMTTMLSGYNYATPVSKEANLLTAKALVNQAINEKGLQVTNNPNGGLKLVTNEGMDYYENNAVVSVSDFTDRVLTQHKLLVTNNGGSAPQNPTIPNGTQPAKGNNKFASELDKMIAEAEGK